MSHSSLRAHLDGDCNGDWSCIHCQREMDREQALLDSTEAQGEDAQEDSHADEGVDRP